MKKTKKMVAALEWAKKHGIKASEPDLYNELILNGILWDPRMGEWFDANIEPADKPTDMLRIRIWTDIELVDEFADLVQNNLALQFPFVERSDVYVCRPPKQYEGRVYLTFKNTPLPQTIGRKKRG